MLAWMSYVIVVSLLLSLAALALEHAARIRQKPTRWVWGTSMAASLLVPLIVSSVSVQIPQLAGVADPAIPQRIVAVRDITVSGLSPSGWLAATAGSLSASPDLDRLLQVGWIATSAILLLAVVASSVQLNRRRRHWKRGSMADVPVHISEDAGPAIVGLLDAHIVVPRWLLQCPPDVQELVIAHEQSHLEAHDARLVTMALGLLVCMPWNLPLWWQLRRLRFAIEIDCDARILRRGYDVSRYGETLIAVGERQSMTVTMVAAMSERRSLLEQRLRNMLRRKTRHAHATAVALACLGFAFAVGAAEISPPNKNDPDKSVSDESAGAQAPSGPQAYCVNDSADFYPYTGEPCKSGYQFGPGNCRKSDGRMVAVPREECLAQAGTVEVRFFYDRGSPPPPPPLAPRR